MLMHGKLAHLVGYNCSGTDRHQLYLRFGQNVGMVLNQADYDDMWNGFSHGVRRIVEQMGEVPNGGF